MLSTCHDMADLCPQECPGELAESKSLSTLWENVQRFISAFLEPISFGSLHIYASALPHCPQHTKLWEWYGKHAKVRVILGAQLSAWPSNPWRRSSDASVAFSPDGSAIASGLDDGTIRLLDTQ